MSGPDDFAINGRFLGQTPTGVQRYAYQVTKALGQAAAQGASIPLLLPAGCPDPGLVGIEAIKVGAPLKGHAWEQALPASAASKRLLNLCNTAPLMGREQIICIHDANVFAEPGSYSTAFRAYYRTLQPLVARRAAQVVTVSHASARQLSRYLSIPQDKIAVLPNGHEHVFDWRPSAAVRGVEVADGIAAKGRRFVMALGSRAQHKNLRLLIAIAPQLDAMGIDIVIAGGGMGIFTDHTLAPHPNVIFAGRVSDDDLAFLLGNSLCLTFPSLTEGFGLPIVEAMALKCPVISSAHSSMLEVCGDAALLASPFDPNEWVAHIRSLANSPALADDLVARGQQQIKQYSWALTAAGYGELVSGSVRRSVSLPNKLSASPRVAVIVATKGRPEIVGRTVRHLLQTQTVRPDTVIISCADVSDAGSLADLDNVRIVTGKPGLAAQRNRALDSLPQGTDIVVFFDDDFVARPDWLAAAIQAFADESRLCALTGQVIADGILGPGIGFDEAVALSLIDAGDGGKPWIEPFSPYGCNMAFRSRAIDALRFDERLVLYGWLEDRDFAGMLAKRGGRLAKSSAARGVHMGAKVGRVPGERLGYSQIINPIYMRLKQTMTTKQAAGQIMRNVLSNFGRYLYPEPFIDRRGRAKGNLLALRDLISGKVEPERAAALAVRPRDTVELAQGNAR